MTPAEEYKHKAALAVDATAKARWALLRAVLSLVKEGKTQVAISRELGVSQGHISRLLSHFDLTTQEDQGKPPNPMMVLARVASELRNGAE